MLTRQHRLPKFQKIYQDGRKMRGRYMALQYMCQTQGNTRFGFAVARKIKTKVQKNRLKRQLRSICRTHLEECRDGWDVIVNAFSIAEAASYNELEQDFVLIAGRAGLIRQSGQEKN
jgi:ribonuclease P protein component